MRILVKLIVNCLKYKLRMFLAFRYFRLILFTIIFFQVDTWLDNISLAGLTLSGLVIKSGSANVPIMATLWVLYHSIVNVGRY